MWKSFYIFVPMEKMIYKFLDEYLGDEVTCIKTGIADVCDTYDIFSKKNKSLILFFKVYHYDEDISIYSSGNLTNTVSSFFDVEPKEVMPIIRSWFADKHNIKKVGDLIKFVNHLHPF
jgi:hypothetical protein